MEKEYIVLNNLIERLEEVKYKLLKINNESVWTNCFIPKEKCRSYMNMKNVLNSLVKKTIENKNDDDDIVLNYCKKNTVLGDQLRPQFKNLIDSEEFLEETKNFMDSILKSENLHDYLLTFQELLGDILYSVCQLNSYGLKLSSGVKVKELSNVKNLYISLWELMSATFIPSKRNLSDQEVISNLNLPGSSILLQTEILELQKTILLCLKEMCKVKLQIEYYLKFNETEMQFIKLDSEYKMTGKVLTKGNFDKESQHHNKLRLKESNSEEHLGNDLKTGVCCVPPEKTYNSSISSFPVTLQRPDSGEKYIKSNKKLWQDLYHGTAIQESCENFFDQSLIYSSEFQVMDPTTIFIHSQMIPPEINLLPKTYSLDSVCEENNNLAIVCYDRNSSNENDNTESDIQEYEENGKAVENELSTENSTEEDIFSDQFTFKTQYIADIREKIVSLFDTLRKNELEDNEDIFEDMPLKIPHKMSKLTPNINKNKRGSKSKKNPMKCLNQSSHIKHYKNEYSEQCNNNDNYCHSRYSDKIVGLEPVKFIQSVQSDVIYDERSLIELFRKTERNQNSNSGSCTQGSSFYMWPVEAEYIHVSKEKKNEWQSVFSESSISLDENLFTLHLKKRNEQNQLYDRNLIVLQNTKQLKNNRLSSCSQLTRPFVLFDTDKSEINNVKNLHQNTYYDHLSQYGNNQILPLNKGAIVKGKKDQNTMTMQYTECGDSFVVRNKNFKKEKFNFLNINSYDENNNWNSFLSIFTSKIGPSTQIDHHRMFRKILNNVGTDSFPHNNLFSNVHTLISNSGPFRLFDLNGYPLTDSSGNVLIDPYGKSVVQLDSTGFPKNDVKVFDAAGNSPKDIKFDPTQKPKTNSIIIKLTDNFKRPLHLFDKYDRPLTDSYGKLLVNIHGRPLLRFDNSGRPNTDYRGGPLYTDNGFRWFYKTGEALSKNQLSKQTITDQNSVENIEPKPTDNSCNPTVIEEIQNDLNNVHLKDYNTIDMHGNKINSLNRCNSDIWIKVENVLQHIPKKKINPKGSQTSMIVNNVSITQTPVEKELLKSIIFHDNILHQDINRKNKFYQYLSSNNETNVLNSQKYLDQLVHENKPFVGNHMNYRTKEFLLENNPVRIKPVPQLKNIFTKSTWSKYIFHNQIHQQYNVSSERNNVKKPLKCNQRVLVSKTHIRATPTYHLETGVKSTLSNCNFKNKNYLNNLCNQVLKHRICSQNRSHPPVQKLVFNYRGKQSDTCSTGVTDSGTSESNGHQHRHFLRNNKHILSKSNTSSTYSRKREDTECEIKQRVPNNINSTKIKCPEGSFLAGALSSDETAPFVNVLNRGNKPHEIQVLHKATSEEEKVLSSSSGQNMFSTYSSGDTTQNCVFQLKKGSVQKHNSLTSQFFNLYFEKYHPESKNYNRITDSVTCFFSKARFSTTTGKDNNAGVRRDLKKHCESNSNTTSVQNIIFQKGENQYQYSNNNANRSRKINKNNDRYHNEFKYQNLCEKNKLIKCEQNKKLPKIHKKIQKQKSRTYGKNETNTEKKSSTSNKECNFLAAFLGSPVKYVLNKLDSTRLQKPNSGNNKPAMNPTKETVLKANGELNLANENKQINKTKIKTLNTIGKNKISSTNENTATNNKTKDKLVLKNSNNTLAFRSKSCIQLKHGNELFTMSYSGNENQSQNTDSKKCVTGFLSSSAELRKCSSEISYKTQKKARQSKARSKLKHKKGQYSNKSIINDQKYYTNRYCSKENKKQCNRSPQKSTLTSSTNKIKERK